MTSSRAGGRQALQLRRLDVGDDPVGVQRRRRGACRRGSAARPAGPGRCTRACARRPATRRGSPGPRGSRASAASTRSAVRRSAQLAQRDEIALAEEVARSRARPAAACRPCPRAGARAARRAADRRAPLRRRVEHRVRHRLPDADAGDAADDVVQAFEVLDVERRVDVDARVEQLLDVVPALGMARAFGVGVRQLVDEDERGLRASAASRSNSGSCAPRYSTIRGGRTSRPSSSAAVSARPWVSTMPTTTSTPSARFSRASEQHRVGLADAGGRAEEYLQPAARALRFLALHAASSASGSGASSVIG